MIKVNPLKLKKIKDGFVGRHSGIIAFGKQAYPKLEEGSVIEANITDKNGKSVKYRMTLTSDDMQDIRVIKSMVK